MMPKLWVDSENRTLRTVILGYPDNFHQVPPEIINETQKQTYFGDNPPRRETLIAEMAEFRRVLESEGVYVLRPTALPDVPDQLMPRDIGFVVDDVFVISRMARQSRQREWLGLTFLLDDFDPERIAEVPPPAILEGGDVIVDRGVIYVGIGQRSNEAGAQFLAQRFPQYQIVPVYMKTPDQGEDVLHLDCAFVPVGAGYALIYPDGLVCVPDILRERYRWIEVSRAEQQALATNVLSISPGVVVSRPQMGWVNQALRAVGLIVREVKYDDPPKTGGSFRCTTLPLCRL